MVAYVKDCILKWYDVQFVAYTSFESNQYQTFQCPSPTIETYRLQIQSQYSIGQLYPLAVIRLD